MRSAPSRMILASALLVVVWVLTYWLWPAPDATVRITFDDWREIEGAAIEPTAEDKPAPRARRSDESSENPLGSSFEEAPAPDFDRVVPPEFDEHVIREGETIWSIAEERYGDRNLGMVIARANPEIDPQRLRSGRRILIPKDPRNVQGRPADDPDDEPTREVVEYVVETGDTLTGIAHRFYGRSTLWTIIRDANSHQGLNRDGSNLRVGMKLVIPPPPPREGGRP